MLTSTQSRTTPSMMTYGEAIVETLSQEMERDPTVFVMGEDVAGGMGASGKSGSWGGSHGNLQPLLARFGRERVMDTPISEAAFLGAAAGAAIAGFRPVVEIMFVDFFGVCFDQLLNNIAKFRYMSGGQIAVPLTIRATCGAGIRAAAQHSQCLFPLLTHIPGIKVLVPACASDVKGLLSAAIRDDDPVIVLEHRNLLDQKEQVPAGDYVVPIGKARVVRPGSDITLVGASYTARLIEDAADQLALEGINAEVIDLRSLSPIDETTILESVTKTARLLVVDESPPRCSIAADIISRVATSRLKVLRAVDALTCPHTPVPFAGELEDLYVPTTAQICDRARNLLKS